MAVLRNNQLSSGRTIARIGVIRKGQLSIDQTNSIGGSGRVVIGKNRLSDIPRNRAGSIGVRDDRRRPPRIIIPPVLPPIRVPPPDMIVRDPIPPPSDYLPIRFPPGIDLPPGVPPPVGEPPGGFIGPTKEQIAKRQRYLESVGRTQYEEEAFVMENARKFAEETRLKRQREIARERKISIPGGIIGGRILKPVERPITGGGILRPISSDPFTPLGTRTVIREGAVSRVRGVSPPIAGGGQPVSVGGNGGGFASGLEEAVSSITSPENKTILYIMIGAIALVGFMAMRK